MAKWKPDQDTFTVKVRDGGEHHGVTLSMPRPLYEELGKPKKITFEKKNGKIIGSVSKERK